jgi:hypothetical protein
MSSANPMGFSWFAENRFIGMMRKRPYVGRERMGTVYKETLCNAFLLDLLDMGPYIIITSHLPKPGSSSHKMLELARPVIYDVIVINSQDDMQRLRSYLEDLPVKTRPDYRAIGKSRP